MPVFRRVTIACILFLTAAFFLPAQEASPVLLYKKAEKFFDDGKWDNARTLYERLIQNHADDPALSPSLVTIRDRIVRCDFYANAFDFETAFKEETGLERYVLKQGRKPYIEFALDFDDEKQGGLVFGGKVDDGQYVQTDNVIGLRLNCSEPFLMEFKTTSITANGMGVVLFASENYKGENEGYFIQLGRGNYYAGVITRGDKKLTERTSSTVAVSSFSTIRIAKINGRISVDAGDLKFSAADSKFRGGYVYLFGLGGAKGLKLDSLTVKTQLDPDWYTSFCGRLEGKRWIEFKEKYDKEHRADAPSEGDSSEAKDDKAKVSTVLRALTEGVIPGDGGLTDPQRATLGECILQIIGGHYNKAEQTLTGLIASLPQVYLPFYLRAVARMENANSEGALADLAAAAALAPDTARIPFAEGVVRMRKEENREALVLFEKAAALDRAFMPAYILQCFALYYDDDISTAETRMQAFLKEFPDDPLMRSGSKMFYLLKNGPEWVSKYTAEGPHYEVYSQISRENAALIKKYAEAVHGAYADFFPYTKKHKGKYKIYVFDSFHSFADYAIDSGEVPPHPAIGGLYNSLLDHLLIRGDKSQRDMLSTLYHEGLHQYLEYYIKDAPIWFNEGLATFFEASYFDQNGFRAGVLNKGRLNDFEQARKGAVSGAALLPLEELMLADASDFMGDIGAQTGVNYAQSWSLVYYMIMNKNVMDEYLRPYFKLLAQGRNKEDAYAEVFKARVKGIETMWLNYYRDKRYE